MLADEEMGSPYKAIRHEAPTAIQQTAANRLEVQYLST